MKTSTWRSNWAVIALGGALVVVYAVFGFLPAEEAIDGLRQRLAAAQEFVGQSGAFSSAIEATQRESDKTHLYVRAWEQSAPSGDDLSGLFGRINRLAKQSGITTTRFEPEPSVQYEKIRRVPVAMACVGSFGQICEFLRGLEGLDETIWVDRLQMEGSEKDGKDVQCDLTLVIFTDNRDYSDQVDHSD